MSWRIVVISKRAKLDYQLGYLVVRNEEVTKIHLSEISTILIESTAATVTTSLLAELTKKKIKVFFAMKREIHRRNWLGITEVMIPAIKSESRFSGAGTVKKRSGQRL